jgi:hypothetical protein
MDNITSPPIITVKAIDQKHFLKSRGIRTQSQPPPLSSPKLIQYLFEGITTEAFRVKFYCKQNLIEIEFCCYSSGARATLHRP